jgi:hypothetical protein
LDFSNPHTLTFMITLPTPTTLEKAALAGAEASHHLASVLRTQYQTFWQRDTAAILAELNADVARNVAIFQLNTQAGIAVNALLDALNDSRFSTRAPVEMPPSWGFEDGQFVFTPPPTNEEP